MSKIEPDKLDQYKTLGQDLIKIFQAIDERLNLETPVSGTDLDQMIESRIKSMGGSPAFKGFQGYPASSCISVNEGVVHCIPTDQPFIEGDIVTVDIGFERDGWIVDSAFTFPIWPVDDETWNLLKESYELLQRAIEQVKPGQTVADLSSKIEEEADDFSVNVMPQFAGHALGKELHESPMIPNRATADDTVLEQNDIIALEPITTQGEPKAKTLDDNWSTETVDGQRSAHFEETIIVADPPIHITPLKKLWEKQSKKHKTLA